MEYFTIEGAPGHYFNCSALRASLSSESCAGRFNAAAHESTCHACEIGALHAGKRVISRRAVPHLLCCRCHELAPRLVAGGICVSCYNRQREVLVGRNAKGTPPNPAERFWGGDSCGKTVRMHRITVGVVHGRSVRMKTRDHAADTLEAMLEILRADGDAAFAWSQPAARVGQLSLFAGA